MSAAAAGPRWSVIVATWNGRALLDEALDGLERQTLRQFETVVVDDASDDGTLEWLAEAKPYVRLVALRRRRGLAHALNRGLEAARGERVALLNNDAIPDPDWLAALDAAFETHPGVGILASRIRLFDTPDRLHAAGDFYTRAGMPGNRGVWQRDDARFDVAIDVFGASAAAAAYRRSVFDSVGGFDEDLGMYCEDVDLSWRAQLAGVKCLYVPDARVRHRLSATAGGPLASYLVGRNRLLVAAMNLPAFVWRAVWPRVLIRQIGISVDALCNVRGAAARATLRGQAAALPLLWRAWRKGRRRRRARRVSEAYIRSLLKPT